MDLTKSLVIACIAGQAIVATATAGESTPRHGPAVASSRNQHASADIRAAAPLDRVVSAVDGAESSHGNDAAMWRSDPSGPQGPMQVSEAAATDVGGGDRFNLAENRAIGRAYLQQLFWRYRNWPDAIAAYNWGVGKMDAWVKAGRPPDKLLTGVALYLRRVLHDSGLCAGIEVVPTATREASATKEAATSLADPLVSTACSTPDGSGAVFSLAIRPSRFYTKLELGLQLALQRSVQSR